MSSTICPIGCVDFNLTKITSASCDKKVRKRILRAIGFYNCATILPNPLTCDNIAPLMTGDTPALVFSEQLNNVTLSDPQTVQRKTDDGTPAVEIVVSRDINFEAKLAIDLDSAGANSPFYDYKFWKNKKQNQARLNYVLLYDNGDLVVPRDENSLAGMSASLSIFISEEKEGDNSIIEVKKGKITFLGDPLDFNEPALNLKTCPALAGLY